MHVVSHRHGLPRPASPLAPLGEGLQDQLLPTPMHGYMSTHFLGVSGSFAKIGRKACFHGASPRCKTHCAGWWLCPRRRCRCNGARERLKMRRCKGTCLFSFLLFRLVSYVGWSPRGVPSPHQNSSGTWQRVLERVLVSAWYK